MGTTILYIIGGIFFTTIVTVLATINNGVGMFILMLLLTGVLATAVILMVKKLRQNKWGYIGTIGGAFALTLLLWLVTTPATFVALMIYITAIALLGTAGLWAWWMVKRRDVSVPLASLLAGVGGLIATLSIVSILASSWQTGRAVEMKRQHPETTDLQLLQDFDDWCPIEWLPLGDSMICRA